MDYKDTVMTRKKLNAINDIMPSTAKYGEVFEKIADEQAKISFKAGINEVVTWVDNHVEMTSKRYDDWRAYKISLGIKLYGT